MNISAELQQKIEPLLAFFDAVRIVNPLTNEILIHHDGQTEKGYVPNHPCYAVWEREHVCENCVSMNAFRLKTTEEKLEYRNGKIFLILATPVATQGETYVIEALRQVGNPTFIENFEQKTHAEIKAEIARLNAQLVRDELTQAYNRTYLLNRLPNVLAKHQLDLQQASVLAVFDIDNFKNINDEFGHLAGDLVLKAIVERANQTLTNQNHWFVRLGGDEFVLVATAPTLIQALSEVQEVQGKLATVSVELAGKIITPTLSSGMTVIQPADKLEDVMHHADRAMYQQKKMKKAMAT